MLVSPVHAEPTIAEVSVDDVHHRRGRADRHHQPDPLLLARVVLLSPPEPVSAKIEFQALSDVSECALEPVLQPRPICAALILMKHTPKNQHREWDAEACSGQTGKHV
jgi:hypothetical protein